MCPSPLIKMLLYWLLQWSCWAVIDAVQAEASWRFSCGSCALCTGDIRVSIYCHHLKCSLRWMDPYRACEWMSPRTGQDYKLSDKEEQGELISKSSRPGFALCRAAELPRPFCISLMLRVPGRGRGTCLKVREPSGLHRARLSLNMIDCDIGASDAETTLRGWSGYLLFSSPRFCGSYSINMSMC